MVGQVAKWRRAAATTLVLGFLGWTVAQTAYSPSGAPRPPVQVTTTTRVDPVPPGEAPGSPLEDRSVAIAASRSREPIVEPTTTTTEPEPEPTTVPVTIAQGRNLPTVEPASTPSGDAWARLRQCESSGNYQDDTGNGYYGAYQFSADTWHGLGYGGLPSEAAPGVQDEAARKLQARSGWGQWPACSRKLGLR